MKDEQYVKRFRHEAAAAGSLNHPNIVQVYMVGEDNGMNYIAQEYVQGRTLKEYLLRKGPLEARIALHILRQITHPRYNSPAKTALFTVISNPKTFCSPIKAKR